MTILDKIVCQKMYDLGCDELLVIMDSKFIIRMGKMVYVRLALGKQEEPKVEYFVKSSSGNGDVVISVSQDLYDASIVDNLYGVHVDGMCSLTNSNVTVCTSLGLLIIESCLYQTTRKLAISNISNIMIQIGGVTNSLEVTRSLVTAFREHSYKNYADLIYSMRNNRFLNKLIKSKKFYAIQKTFVPVFVDYRYIYNPFADKNLHVEDMQLYKMAVDKGRFVQYEEKLSGYLLTHREICECFNMKHFIRFTPNFCYKLFVGLLNPALESFPNKLTRVFVTTDNNVAEYGLKKSYTISEFLEVKGQYEKFITDKNAEARAAEKAKEAIGMLGRYIEIDSLYEHCMLAYDGLVSFGPTGLDNKEDKTLQKIYSYVSEAELRM